MGNYYHIFSKRYTLFIIRYFANHSLNNINPQYFRLLKETRMTGSIGSIISTEAFTAPDARIYEFGLIFISLAFGLDA